MKSNKFISRFGEWSVSITEDGSVKIKIDANSLEQELCLYALTKKELKELGKMFISAGE